MHPAPSIILFTVLSGLGFGLLAFLGLGYPAVTGWVAFAFFVVAYLLAVGGLAASTFHLGHPERALKAFTQWRTSWLSREAWLSTATLIAMALYGAGAVFFETHIAPLGWLGAALSLATVVATSMIYAQLRTVPRWHHWSTPALFLGYAVTGGALLSGQIGLAAPLLLALGAAQIAAWVFAAGRLAGSGSDIATATGLGEAGALRSFEPPHTGTNYLLDEMVHVVGRRRARTLRIIALVFMAGLPWALLSLLPFSHVLSAVAILSHLIGVLAARWLFFAEAEHVVGFYYGKR